MAVGSLTIEVCVGPNVRALIDIVETVRDLAELVPEWNRLERDQALSRVIENALAILGNAGARRNDGRRKDGGDLA